MALTDVKVRNAKPAEKHLKLFDGDGMFLLVTPQGGKCWRLKYRFGGKEKLLALGTYPEVSLAELFKMFMGRGVEITASEPVPWAPCLPP